MKNKGFIDGELVKKWVWSNELPITNFVLINKSRTGEFVFIRMQKDSEMVM